MTLSTPEPSIAVSVIVPVYNAAEHLPRCLDSLCSQTLRTIEVVAVDDASADASGRILRRYAAADQRLRVIRHESNQGLHAARITGALAATGRYLGYVDSDDYVVPDTFEALYDAASIQKADIVRTGAWLRHEDAHQRTSAESAPDAIRAADRVYESGVEYLNTDFYPSMWLYLHHRRLWQKALPHIPRGRFIGEDNLTSFLLAFFADRVVSLPTLHYCHIQRADSLSGEVSVAAVRRHIEDRAAIVQHLREFVARNGRAEPGWKKLCDDNRELVRWYIESLPSPADQDAAWILFRSVWESGLASPGSAGDSSGSTALTRQPA